MSGEDDGATKRHEPTQKKLDDARRKGEVPKSLDLAAAAGYVGLLLCFWALGEPAVMQVGASLQSLIANAGPLSRPGAGPQAAWAMKTAIANSIAPLAAWFLIPGLLVVLSLFAQRGLTFSPEKVRFKLSRVSPIQNAKNKYGLSGLFEFAKSLVKLVIYSTILGLFLSANLDRIGTTLMTGPGPATLLLAQVMIEFLLIIVMIALAIGFVDLMWQRADHLRKNRMSDKDLRDEHKETEGDSHMKQARREKGQQIAANRMLNDVPGADVVIVNPTHFAVALKWDRQRGSAPICVAKGQDMIAKRIREMAIEAGVPIRSDPPTARALHASTEIGQEIAVEHYRAVAAAIRFADGLRRRTGEEIRP
ncbi:MAG: flagellar biosynthetic protein FlhB [Rhodobacteraceae bacterium HLUCCO07]|nr:MAG: flagellar biosynthetic protein FlhB [Rhodobacteraceae bacterium HLUCCO07]